MPMPISDSGIRILLVEDNDISRQLMCDYLTNCGYHLLSLADGDLFKAAVAHFRPHVILLDIKLPDLDGYTLLQQLQQEPDWRSIPVVMVSAYAFQGDRQRAFELGAQQYLVKPVKLADLTRAIHNAVNYSLV